MYLTIAIFFKPMASNFTPLLSIDYVLLDFQFQCHRRRLHHLFVMPLFSWFSALVSVFILNQLSLVRYFTLTSNSLNNVWLLLLVMLLGAEPPIFQGGGVFNSLPPWIDFDLLIFYSADFGFCYRFASWWVSFWTSTNSCSFLICHRIFLFFLLMLYCKLWAYAIFILSTRFSTFLCTNLTLLIFIGLLILFIWPVCHIYSS